MREYHVKESFLDRMYGEYQAHKASVLGLTNAEIYNRSGEVNAVEELYGIMTEKAESLPEEVLAALLQHREILCGLYESWHQNDGYGYGGMERYAEHEIWRTVQGMEGMKDMKYNVTEHFLDRLYGEYQAYKASVLSCPNEEIFSRCYEIDVMVNFYEILAEKADSLTENVLTALLQHKNILAELYELWLKKDDCNYREMESHVENEIENIIKKIPKGQEGDIYGR